MRRESTLISPLVSVQRAARAGRVRCSASWTRVASLRGVRVARTPDAGEYRGFHTCRAASECFDAGVKILTRGRQCSITSHEPGPVHSWPHVKIFTPRHLSRRRVPWNEHALCTGSSQGHDLLEAGQGGGGGATHSRAGWARRGWILQMSHPLPRT